MPKDGPKQNQKSNPLAFMRVPSRVLKLIVNQHEKSHSAERFLAFIANIRRVFEQYSSSLAEFEPGVDRAMVAHRLMNQSIHQSLGRDSVNPTCSRGCGACCYLEVEVTTDEGKLLGELVKAGIEIDRKNLESQASRKRRSPEWDKRVVESNRCVFLGPDQSCRIYDFRPLACRKHMVSTPPDNCAKGTDEPILLPLAEIAISAALSQPGNTISSLTKTLNTVLGKKEKRKSTVEKTDLPLEI